MKKMKGFSIQKIGGKNHSMKWGLNQSMFYCELRGISIDEMNKQLTNIAADVSVLRDLLWSAFKDGARVDNKEFTLSNFDIADLMEDMESGEIETLLSSMTKTLPKPRPSKKKQ
jgi:hypothetical protein